jgi:glyoxylase-like metal-dependent hydrolase (beta-lactamase superfamily II)
MHPWFAVQKVDSGVWLIAEPGHVNSWLVEGHDRAVLIDTGLGIGPIRALAQSLTHAPVSVVNTHAHFDHIGGNREFSDVTIHELGVAKLRQGVPPERLTAYLAYTRRVIAAADQYRKLDQRYFFLVDDTSDPRPLPSGFKDEDWRIGPSEATSIVGDGDKIDLGGRCLTVLHTPGHSPDSISLLDEAAGILFAGDTINTGPIYAHLPDSDIDQFAASVARLKMLSASLHVICMSHFGRAIAHPWILDEVAQAFIQLKQGDVPLSASQDALGRPVAQARFAHFSILLPQNKLPLEFTNDVPGQTSVTVRPAF